MCSIHAYKGEFERPLLDTQWSLLIMINWSTRICSGQWMSFISYVIGSALILQSKISFTESKVDSKENINTWGDGYRVRGTSILNGRQNRDSNRDYLLPHILPLIFAHGPPCLQPKPKNGHYLSVLFFLLVVSSIAHLPLIESAA